MVAVAVRGVDRGQVLAMRFDPLHQGARLLNGEQGVDEHGVPLPGDEGSRDRRPQPLLPAWGQVGGANGNARRYIHVPVKLNVSRFDVSHNFLSLLGGVRFIVVSSLPVSLPVTQEPRREY